MASSIMSVVESRRKERVSATRIAPGPRCRVATSSRLVMQPIRSRAFCNRSMTIGATASPAIRLRVSLASTLASKRPMAIDAMPSAQVTWKERGCDHANRGHADADQRRGILKQHREQCPVLRYLDEVPQAGGPSAHDTTVFPIGDAERRALECPRQLPTPPG